MVLGLFRNRATPLEFGQGVLHLTRDFICSDAGRSLGMRFDNFDGSDGWGVFLERRSIPMPLQLLHLRLYAHSAIQAFSSRLEAHTARELTRGAMNGFVSAPDGYEFDSTYRALDTAYRGCFLFSPLLEPLTNLDARLGFLPNPDAGVLSAKYLIETFVFPHMANHSAFVEDFHGYSSTLCATIGTVRRAFDHLSRSFKLS